MAPRSRRTSGSPRAPASGAPLSLVPWRETALVAGAALALRAVYWLLYSRTPFFSHPVIDASFFDLWARAIVAGQPFPPGAAPDAWFKPPLYPYLLAAVYRLAGPSALLVYALQSLLGAVTAVLVLALGRLAFSPAVARGGAFAAALLPILPFFELQLVAETLTTFLSLLAWLWVLRSRSPAGGWRGGRLVAAGALLGLAALGRPNVMILPPLAAWWLWRQARGAARRPAGALAWRPALLLLLGTALVLLPSTLRNLAVGRALVPVSANFGVNLWTGNHAGADGVSAVPVGLRWDDLQLHCRQAGYGSAAASSRLLAREALAWIGAEPGRALTLLGKRALVLLNAAEVRNNIGPAFLAREYGVVTLARWWPGTWLLLPFTLLGLALTWRRPGAARLLALYLAGLALSVLPFFANARFRAPLLPVAALFAAAGAAEIAGRWRARRWRGAGPLLAALAAAFVLVNVDWFRLDNPAQDARDHFNLAEIQKQMVTGSARGPATAIGPAAASALDAAEAHLRRAMEMDPSEPDYPEGLGALLLLRAQPLVADAADLPARGYVGDPGRARDVATRWLGQAAQLHQRAIALLPRSYRSQANLGGALLLLGDCDVALLRRQGASADTSAALARARGHYRDAAAALREALRINPNMREAAANLRLCEARLESLSPS